MSRLGPRTRFRRLWAATGVSAVGDGMVLVAFPLLALRYTHNPLLVAAVAVSSQLPAVLVGLPSGVLADRVNKRRLLLSLELVRFAVLTVFASILVLGRGDLPLLYLSAFVLGALSVSFDVVASAALPSVVPHSDLMAANTRLLSTELTGEELIGQAAGGAAFVASSFVPFIADAASFALSAVLLSSAVPDTEPNPSAGSAWGDLRQGLRWFVKDPTLRLLTGVISLLALCQGAVFAILVLYAATSLHLHGAGYGLLLAAAATGNLLAAPIAPRVHRWLGSAGCIVGAGAAAALAYLFLGVTHSSVAAGIALSAETGAVLIGNVTARSLRQTIVPSSLQGRAGSVFQTVVLIIVPLGGLAGGVASAAVGIRDTFLAAGMLQLLLVALLAPRLRTRLAGLKDAEPDPTTDEALPEGGVASVRLS